MITIYDWFGYDMPMKTRYQLIKEAGFDGVLLWWSDGFGRDIFGQNDYRNGPDLIRGAGLIIENIHTPFHNENTLWQDNLDGAALTQTYLQCVADCAAFEIPTMVVHLPDDGHPHNSMGLDRIRRFADKAEQLGVNVAMENIQNLDNLTYVLSQIDSPRIGFCYDCCHHYNNFPDADLLSRFGSRLMSLHLHDNGDGHTQHTLPFDGIIDWQTAMKKIAATGYSGATAIEAMNWAYEDWTPGQFLSEAYSRARRLEALRRQ